MQLNPPITGLTGVDIMSILSKRLFQAVARDYRAVYGLSIRLVDCAGEIILPEGVGRVETLPVLNRIRAQSLTEALRWGEPQAFFIGPGMMSWIAPLVEQTELRGGLTGGCIALEDDPQSLEASVSYLVTEGAGREEARAFVKKLPLFAQERVNQAAVKLYDLFSQYSGWQPLELTRMKERMLQQRQIAEEIHQRKGERNRSYPYDDERKLLSLIRGGDRAGARRTFNKMLAAMFLYSPRQTVVRARAIEMMGYLVRAAVEDSPLMEPLLDRHMRWIEQMAEARDFDDLCNVLLEALDDFMNSLFLPGVNPVSPAVCRALEYISANYTEAITLKEIAAASGLSTFRIAHLLKESTGRTALQNILYLRIQEARHLLEASEMSCSEIAYETGFGDQSYFIRQFRKGMGITPSQYRRSCQR